MRPYTLEMDIRNLQSFIAVADSGSMAAAARFLDITPAAVAARIRSLENHLGVSLVARTGRYVKPTTAGLQMLARSRAVLGDLRDLHAVARDGVPLGELRIGVFVSAMTSILPKVLEKLYTAHPQLAVYVAPGASIELCRLVASGELDAAIVVEPQFAVAKSCEWRVLIEEPLVVVAPSSMANRDPHALLSQEPFIRYDRSVLGGRLADMYLRDHDIHPRQRLEINSLMTIAALIDRGLGVSLLPDWVSLWQSQLDIIRIALPTDAPVRRVG